MATTGGTQTIQRKAQFQGSKITAQRSPSPTSVPQKQQGSSSDVDRKAALLSSRVQSLGKDIPLLQARLPQPMQPQTAQETDEEEAQEQEEENQEELEQQRVSMLQQALMSEMNQSQDGDQENEKGNTAQDAVRKEVKKKAKAGAKRGFIFILDLIASAFDLSTAGISFIIDIFIYLFSLSWLNLEMIYGTHFTKGKSKFISPLSWDPIPMPIDPHAFWLQGIIVAADIALGVAIVILGAGGMCILSDYVKLVSDAWNVGKAIAGGGGDMCLGGIMSLVINGL